MDASHQITQRDGITIITLGTEYENLDDESLDCVSTELLDLAARSDPPALIVDMSSTTFFGSAFLGILFRVWHRLKARDGRMAVCGAQGPCQEVLRVTQVNQLWPVVDDCNAAVDALKQ